MLNKCCGLAVASLFLVSSFVLAQTQSSTPGSQGNKGRSQTTTQGTGGAQTQSQDGTSGSQGNTNRPQQATTPGTGGGFPGASGFPGGNTFPNRGYGAGASGAHGQGRSVADLIARLAQIKQQREAMDKEESEVLARLKEELPKEHKALEMAEKTLQEYHGAATDRSGAQNTQGRNTDQNTTALFNRYAQGQDHLIIGQIQNPSDPQLRTRLMQFAQREGITNGRLSREQFDKFMRQDRGGRTGRQGATPAGYQTAPGGPGVIPGNQGNVPGGQRKVPGNQGAAPGNQGAAPGNQGTAPAVPGTLPRGQQQRGPGQQ